MGEENRTRAHPCEVGPCLPGTLQPLGHAGNMPAVAPLPQSPPGLGQGAPAPPKWVPALLSSSGSVVGDLSPCVEWGVGWQCKSPSPIQGRNPEEVRQVKGPLRGES